MDMRRSAPALVFDLDGTLVDSVYQHVLAWQEALLGEGIELSVWRIHRKIGMSGGLFAQALLRETQRNLPSDVLARLPDAHVRAYAERARQVQPLPGARELLERLTELGIPWRTRRAGALPGPGQRWSACPSRPGRPWSRGTMCRM